MNKHIEHPKDYILTHKALYDKDARVVMINGESVEIKTHPNEYRYVEFWVDGHKVTIAQQNLKKASIYADKVRKWNRGEKGGERISWIMPAGGAWKRIDGYAESQYPELFQRH